MVLDSSCSSCTGSQQQSALTKTKTTTPQTHKHPGLLKASKTLYTASCPIQSPATHAGVSKKHGPLFNPSSSPYNEGYKTLVGTHYTTTNERPTSHGSFPKYGDWIINHPPAQNAIILNVGTAKMLPTVSRNPKPYEFLHAPIHPHISL